jgi:hypothetical protein
VLYVRLKRDLLRQLLRCVNTSSISEVHRAAFRRLMSCRNSRLSCCCRSCSGQIVSTVSIASIVFSLSLDAGGRHGVASRSAQGATRKIPVLSAGGVKVNSETYRNCWGRRLASLQAVAENTHFRAAHDCIAFSIRCRAHVMAQCFGCMSNKPQ